MTRAAGGQIKKVVLKLRRVCHSGFRFIRGFSARNVAAALTDFQSTVRRSLITSDCYPLRGDFRLCHGVWPRAHLFGPGVPVSPTPWLLHRLKLISLPHWPIIKSWNSVHWRVEAGEKQQEKESSFSRGTWRTFCVGAVDSLGVEAAEVELCVGGLLAADASWQICWLRKWESVGAALNGSFSGVQ